MRAALCTLVGLALLATIPSCLQTLPEPIECPAKAKYDACSTQPAPVGNPPQGPSPPVPPSTSSDTCTLPTECLRQQGRTCECTAATQCTRANSCNPPPDCPASVRGTASGATCVDGTTSFAVTQQKPTCACGCASCAEACDGQGPILGAGQSLRVELPSTLPSKGKLGMMVRIRGSSLLTGMLNLSGKTQPLTATATPGSREEFVEVIMGPAASWTADTKPVGFVLTAPQSVEIDCIVPYFTP